MLFAVADVTGDEGRSLLRRELLHPDYNQQSAVERIFGWIMEFGDSLLSRANSLSAPSAFAVIVVLFVLFGLLILFLGRVRRSSATPTREGPAVLDATVSAAEFLALAEAAHRGGDLRGAAVAAFRSAATRQVERGLLDPNPGATARDVARSVSERDTVLGTELKHAAAVFEVALYSRLEVEAEEVDRLLALARDERVPEWAAARLMEVPR